METANVKEVEEYADQSEYVKILGDHFGSSVFDDPIAELRNLKQEGSLQDYFNAFDGLYPKAGIIKY